MKNQLDLHGIKHADINQVVSKFIDKHIQSTTLEVMIITGNSDNMKKIVKETLRDYYLTAEESLINPGKLIVNLS
jgi:DNA-nicking Smr family endonuclease